ncbi:UDP-N-acetylglucosamine--undecaprenyl-phosphate N-acetylglucosaminephosphotransferase [Serratia quinivorans]|uniref:UDP-N-acetylglucosamine--undecaprenyl-phosphate N-acetylglucosaminephosphotransferase n=1 Tax=Serratia quinivorans TaxID=137545 RepID=UPI002177A44A|nr:UDP-N-acetylglucosamine--undecaprenyl-phosphate N-acetylglucosaminephosphotransferase [Serratia quinivorans]CAI0761290.1 Undecaprenyl-phosphate alpha-N-acetylglucosaminyl 1-phosphate transferase [Serratia quinivorans]CAI0766127.1 Undecaprenyl-phosphate alpha-N-acetylglucosaminyl 1-phosphate transferase [Serratia quinivorans]CAI0788479.1 Undecaprenyl-phosphate alpha-N-acetylglucosaminyl 1-phosphate transferase [Serratia quinivorans]CAI1696865.1 Undecaprenyl-phosphate alpha-N-acetylglucosaminy
MLYQLSVIFILALMLVVIARRAALAVGLVDKPNARKRHQGHVPLVGGIAIYLIMTLVTFWQPDWLPHSTTYLLCVTALVMLGVLDDRFDLPVAPRVIVQGGIALAMMLAAGMQLSSLGFLWGHQEMLLGYAALLITPLAVWGAINAYNMVDGIDGQLGALSCVTFMALAILFGLAGHEAQALWCLSLIVALAAYLLFNLSVFGARNKIFMGDAGSMVIGFSVLWLLIVATQGEDAVIRPVTALWLIAIPLMDMVTVMVRRLMRRQSPFKAGRDHLHHILMRRGLNARQALGMSCMLAVTLACVGICSEVLQTPDHLMLLAFVFCFFGYFALLHEPRQARVFTDNPTADR